MPGQTDYLDGTYFRQNPDWHVRDSPWKVQQILRILNRNQIVPKTICEAGCGAGEVLRLLQQNLDPTCELWGVDISAQAIELCKARANERLHFALFEDQPWEGKFFEPAMAIDVIAHVEDLSRVFAETEVAGHLQADPYPPGHFGAARSSGESMIRRRQQHPHLHYFSKRTAMFALVDLGYEIRTGDQAFGHEEGNAGKSPREILEEPGEKHRHDWHGR
jgi:SAM-dependent methyltransferase